MSFGNDYGGFGQVFDSSTIDSRVSALENEIIKRTYYQIVSTTSGSIPTSSGVTLVAGQFGQSGNSILSQVDGSGYPLDISPTDGSGSPVTSTLNVVTGNWITSGVYTQSSVAIFFVVTGTVKYINLFEIAYPLYISIDDIGKEYVAGTGISIVTNVISATTTGTVSSFSAGNLSPLFTTSVANPTTTPALSFVISNSAANTIYGNFTNGSTSPSFNSASVDGQLLVRRSGALTFGTLVTGDIPNITNVSGNALTGYISGAGTVSGTDTILTAIQKLNGNTSALVTGVSSVFTRAGAVTAQSGDYNTSQVTENTNLYFTNARSIASTLTGYSSGAGIVSSSDSILSAIQKLNGNTAALVTGVSSVTGTTNRITASPTTGAVIIDISASYIGQSSITTVGTISTGTWSGLFGAVTGANLTNLTAANISAGTAGINITGNSATVTTNANLTGEVTSVGNAATISNGAVIGKVLTGYVSGAGTVSASDSILSAIQKLNGNISAAPGTVTSVSVVTANGVSGSVATATTTPAITLTLGAITPTSVTIGTLGYTDTGILISGQASANSYEQIILRNSNAGAAASADYIVSNDSGTATTFYGDFGINSSVFTGSGSLNLANATYLTSTSGDLVFGTTTSNSIRFVINGGTTDAAIFDTSGNFGIAIAPITKLHVAETSTSNYRGGMIDQYNAGTNGSRFFLRKSRGTAASPNTTIVTGDILGSLFYSGNDGTTFIDSGGVRVTSVGTIATNRVPSKMELMTATDAAPSVLTTALTLDQSQNAQFAGNITSGGWQGSVIAGTYGGTGVNNSTRTMTYAGNVAFTGAFNPTFSIPQSTTWTLPNTASETLAGLGTAQTFTKGNQITISSTLADGANAFSVTATMPTVMAGTNNAVNIAIASAGSSAQSARALSVSLSSGYTGSTSTTAGAFANSASGTGAGLISSVASNYSLTANTTGTTTGYNVGIRSIASNGNLNAGVVGQSTALKNSATNIGGAFFGRNTGTTPIQVGAYIGLNSTDPTFVSAALIVDNSDQASPISLFRANGTTKITFDQNGLATFAAGIIGVTDASSATAGNIGEEIISTISTYTNYTTTVTYQNITSITLTAGDWDISAFATFSSNTATITAAGNAIFAIATTTASATGSVEGKSIAYIPQAALLGTSLESVTIEPVKVTISGSTTYYFTTQAAFTLGNPQFVGTIRARRLR